MLHRQTVPIVSFGCHFCQGFVLRLTYHYLQTPVLFLQRIRLSQTLLTLNPTAIGDSSSGCGLTWQLNSPQHGSFQRTQLSRPLHTPSCSRRHLAPQHVQSLASNGLTSVFQIFSTPVKQPSGHYTHCVPGVRIYEGPVSISTWSRTSVFVETGYQTGPESQDQLDRTLGLRFFFLV